MEEGDPSCLLSNGEAAPGVLGLVLVYLRNDRHGRTGERPGKGHKDGGRTGTPLL